jgi:D-alanyl-D-alanine-carboxypeptidase/D-alanyl-D-alanine-endopeptidase
VNHRLSILLSRILPVLALAALLPAVPARAADPAPPIPDEVKANVKSRVDGGLAPGIVVGIIVPGGESYFSYGALAAGKPGDVDADTIFEIGSMTKAFTGTLLADMVRRGEVKLDDPVTKYLPDTVKVPHEGPREITLLDLATHRSGLARMPENFRPADTHDPYVDYTADLLYAYLAEATLDHPIGTAYEYSNLGMGLLGHALARAAKTDYETLVRQRIAKPLKMTVTSTQDDEANAKRRAQGHTVEGVAPVPAKAWTWRPSSVLVGCGGLRSTAREMLRFVAANAGLVDSPLSAAMKDAQQERFDAGSPKMGIGLAWHLRKSGDRVLVWHNGATAGFHSFVGFDPKTKTGVVVLCNSTENIDDIGIHVLDPESPLKEGSKAVAVSEAKLARLDGHYDLGGAMIDVTHEGSQLYAQVTGQQRFPVFPKSETVFFYRVVPAELEFAVGADGTVSELTLHQGGRDIPAKKVAAAAAAAPKERKEVPVDAKILADYVGKYEFAPGVVFDVALKEGHLACQLADQPRIEVYAESDTTFFYKVVDAQLTFVRNAAGKVESVTLHQGGADQTAKRAN